jgi:hypothetical protein
MYTFPFSTCEVAQKGVAQPFSAAVNSLNCAMLLYFLVNARTRHAALLMASFLLFEVFHTYSHVTHIAGNVQQTIIHLMAYLVNASLFYAFYSHTRKWPVPLFWAFVTGIIAVDVYAFLYWPLVFSIGTQSLLLVAFMFYYRKGLPTLWPILGMIGVILFLVWNEAANCTQMLQAATLPYHVVIEIAGLFLFFLLGKAFYQL